MEFFDNESARNFLIFGVDNSSQSNAGNRKNNFLELSDGPTFGIDGSFDSAEKKFSINFSKANTKFCLNLHYKSSLFNNGKKSLSLKLTVTTLIDSNPVELKYYLFLISLDKYSESCNVLSAKICFLKP